MAFRVGVVGHRPDRLGHADLLALEKVVGCVLSAVRTAVETARREAPTLYSDTAPILRAVSPLAEGTDRLFAEQALNCGFELCCVMPFPQAEFEKDFADGTALEPQSQERFLELLSRAEAATKLTRFELAGDRDDAPGAYAACGRVVLNQSDLLVVVWDGERGGKRGGTEQTFEEARLLGAPIVWIDAHAPHAMQVVDAAALLPAAISGGRLVPDGSADNGQIQRTVRRVLDLPEIAGADAKAHGRINHRRLDDFYGERRPARSWAFVWGIFQSLVADFRWPKVEFAVPDFEAAVAAEWPSDPTSPVGRLVGWLRPYFAWPDQLAVLYSRRYRSAFVLAFLFAAAAVGLALLPEGAGFGERSPFDQACMVLELAAIITILGLVLNGRRRRWHDRWLDYRLTAELVRHARLVAPLGGGRPFPQAPAHWTAYGQPGATWMAWYVRAVERALGLPNVVVDDAHVLACLKHVEKEVERQNEYHERTTKRCHNLEHRLHVLGMAFLFVTLLACGLHLCLHHPGDRAFWTRHLPRALTFLCGFLPALGAGMAGISNQGEFRRIARRSEAMEKQLAMLLGKVRALRSKLEVAQRTGPSLAGEAAALSSEVAALLVNEVLDWRVVLLDRPLVPPA